MIETEAALCHLLIFNKQKVQQGKYQEKSK